MDTNAVLLTLIGAILGALFSLIIPFILYKVFVPKIKFADEICKGPPTTANEIYNYRLKFRNLGRDIFELNIYCVISIPNLRSVGTYQRVELNVYYNFKPVLKRKDGQYHDCIVRISFNDDRMRTEFMRPIYEDAIREKADKRELTLEDLLTIKQGTYLNFYISAHDKLLGNKKMFESKPYSIEDIKFGKYKFGELCVVQKDEV